MVLYQNHRAFLKMVTNFDTKCTPPRVYRYKVCFFLKGALPLGCLGIKRGHPAGGPQLIICGPLC